MLRMMVLRATPSSVQEAVVKVFLPNTRPLFTETAGLSADTADDENGDDDEVSESPGKLMDDTGVDDDRIRDRLEMILSDFMMTTEL